MLTRRVFLAAGAAACGSQALAQVVTTMGDGEDNVVVLSDGGFEMPLSMLARDVATDVIAAAETGRSSPYRTVLNVTCLKRGADTILFDCGAGANFLSGSGKLAGSLEAAGIAPDSVTHVVFTHLHPDHFWGSLDDFDSPIFPKARWLVAESEIAFWTDAKVYDRLPEDRQAFAAGAQRIAKELGDRLERHSPGKEWLPGLEAIATPGHTPGHTSFAFRAAGERVVVLGDALTHPVISFRHPEWRPATDHDAELAVSTRRRLLDRLAAEQATIIGYHLPGAVGRVARRAEGYEFERKG